jgi:DNA repair photolyase
MITPYSGEFLISPIALEMSMNYCSHKCAYCFANLNKPDRTFDFDAFVKQIRGSQTRKDLTSYFLKNKYPILLSNKVDPFATSNRYQTLSVAEILMTNGNPIAWQTKGGDAIVIQQVLDLIGTQRQHWYISISFMDDALRKKIEPGAPSIESRFELAQHLIESGQSVSIGLNPLISQWFSLEDLDLFMAKCKQIGITDIWAETLHLNSKQEANMSKKEIEAMTPEILAMSKKRTYNAMHDYLFEVLQILNDNGFNAYTMLQPVKSLYHDAINQVYGNKSLPTLQGFLNWCFDTVPDGDYVYFGEYMAYMEDHMPEELMNARHNDVDGYLYTHQRDLHKRWQQNSGQKRIRTFRDLLTIFWDNPEAHKSLFGIPNFQLVATADEQNNLLKVVDDEFMMPVARFNHKAMNETVYYDFE